MYNIIVAMTKNRVIGRNNKMPWHLKDDLKHFKKTTAQHPIIMGRKTFDSIGQALPLRKNIVVSHNPHLDLQGVELTQSVENALGLTQDADEVFIIGGAEIFEQTLPAVTKMYITEIDAEMEGDVYFPEVDMKQWKLVSTTAYEKNDDNEYNFTIKVYEKKDK